MADLQGSAILKPVADLIGMSLSEINFAASEGLCLVLAIIFRCCFPVSRVGAAPRHVILCLNGLIIAYICFGSHMLYFIGEAAVCYVMILYWPRSSVQMAILTFSLTYLFIMHLYREMEGGSDDQLNFTNPLMVTTQKLTLLGFALSDGQRKDDSQLTADQSKHALRKCPSLLEFSSYILHFQSILVGPFTFYYDYIAFVEGRDIYKQSSIQNVDKKPKSPTNIVFHKILTALCSVTFYLYCEKKVAKYWKMEEGFLNETPFIAILLYGCVATFSKRCLFYTGWLLGDIVCNASGFGFNGYDGKGRPKWDLCTPVDIWKIESALTINQLIANWNIPTVKWLRFVAHDRTSRRWRKLTTIALSSLWHGAAIGKHVFFLHIFLGIGVIDMIPKISLRSRSMRNAYTCLRWVGVKLFFAYTGKVFILSSSGQMWRHFGSWFWCGHILAVIVVLLSASGFLTRGSQEEWPKNNQSYKQRIS